MIAAHRANRASDQNHSLCYLDGLMSHYELPSGRWLKTKDACKELGCCRATLFRRKKEGFFQLGIHFIATGPASKATLLWNIESVRKVQATWSAPVPMQ